MGIRIFITFICILGITYSIMQRIRYHNKIMVSTKIKNIKYQRTIMNAKILIFLSISVYLIYTVFTFEENSFNALKFNMILFCTFLLRGLVEQFLKVIFKRKIKRGELTEETEELPVENEKENSFLNM